MKHQLNDATVDRIDKWSRTCSICVHRCHRDGDGFCMHFTWWDRFVSWFGLILEPCGCPSCACLRCVIRQERGKQGKRDAS